MEKRKYSRLRVYHLVKFLSISKPQGNMDIASLRDISGGGGLLLSDKELPLGSMLQIFINFPRLVNPISSLAKVVWQKRLPKAKKYEIGLQFLDLGDDIRSEIIKNVNRVQSARRK